MSQILDLGRRQQAVTLSPLKLPNESLDSPKDHVVTKVEHEIITNRLLSETYGVSEAIRSLLGDIRDSDSPTRPVINVRQDFLTIGIMDNSDLFDPTFCDRLQRVMEDRVVRNGDQMLVLRTGNRAESSSSSTTRPHCFLARINPSLGLFRCLKQAV
jgi:hypothetical protein